MESFLKLVNDWKLLTSFAKSFILDVFQGYEYTSGGSVKCVQNPAQYTNLKSYFKKLHSDMATSIAWTRTLDHDPGPGPWTWTWTRTLDPGPGR